MPIGSPCLCWSPGVGGQTGHRLAYKRTLLAPVLALQSGSRSGRYAGSQGLRVAAGFPEALPLTGITGHSPRGRWLRCRASWTGSVLWPALWIWATPGSTLRCHRRRRRPRAPERLVLLQLPRSAHQRPLARGCARWGQSRTQMRFLTGALGPPWRTPSLSSSPPLDEKRCPWPERHSRGPQDLPLRIQSVLPRGWFPGGET